MAPKKAPKKAAKKAPGAPGAVEKHGKGRPRPDAGGKDLRRAYEHLHRVGVLHGRLEPTARQQVDALSRAAQAALAAEKDAASAADLLRSAEHVAFASLAPAAPDKTASEAVLAAARHQFADLVDRASDHWEEHDEAADPELAEIFHRLLGAAEESYATGAMYRALEWARAAEALAHTRPARRRKLSTPARKGRKLLG